MKHSFSAKTVVYAAVPGALALVCLYFANMAPTGRWGLTALAGLMPAAAVISAGMSSGVLCWLGVTVLAFFVIPDKLVVLLFGVLFGLYPVVKCKIESLRCVALEYLLKLVFFNVSFTAVFCTMKAAVLDSLPVELAVVWLLYLAGNVVFLVYDYGFTKLISLYLSRVYRKSSH